MNMRMKVENKDGLTYYGGMALNPDEMRLEWRPEDLEENVYVLLGMWGNTLKEIEMKTYGDIEEVEAGLFALNYRPLESTTNEVEP